MSNFDAFDKTSPSKDNVRVADNNGMQQISRESNTRAENFRANTGEHTARMVQSGALPDLQIDSGSSKSSSRHDQQAVVSADQIIAALTGKKPAQTNSESDAAATSREIGQNKHFHYDGEPSGESDRISRSNNVRNSLDRLNSTEAARDIAKTLKSNESPQKMADHVAREMEDALKLGVNLNDLVKDVNQQFKDTYEHMSLQAPRSDGHQSVLVRQSVLGGVMLDVKGNDVHAGGLVR